VGAPLPEPAVAAACALAGRLAAARGRGAVLLAAATGRAPLPEGFTVV
jgi:hypothetical protein